MMVLNNKCCGLVALCQIASIPLGNCSILMVNSYNTKVLRWDLVANILQDNFATSKALYIL